MDPTTFLRSFRKSFGDDFSDAPNEVDWTVVRKIKQTIHFWHQSDKRHVVACVYNNMFFKVFDNTKNVCPYNSPEHFYKRKGKVMSSGPGALSFLHPHTTYLTSSMEKGIFRIDFC